MTSRYSKVKFATNMGCMPMKIENSQWTAAEVREWATQQGIDIAQRGRIPSYVVQLYLARPAVVREWATSTGLRHREAGAALERRGRELPDPTSGGEGMGASTGHRDRGPRSDSERLGRVLPRAVRRPHPEGRIADVRAATAGGRARSLLNVPDPAEARECVRRSCSSTSPRYRRRGVYARVKRNRSPSPRHPRRSPPHPGREAASPPR